MKMTKKWLLGAAVLAAVSFGFMGCGEDDDDENNMISGSNNDYSINYKNEETTVSRGYDTTTFKHAGSLCQMTMSEASAAAGAMGYIWDLESNYAKEGSARAVKDPRRFFIFGFNYGLNGGNGKVAYYLSLYKNVENIQEQNFGATGGTNKESGEYDTTGKNAKETEYIELNNTNVFTPVVEDGNFVVTVDVYEGGTFTVNEKGERTYSVYDGTFVVDIYNGKVEAADIGAAIGDKTATITTAAQTGSASFAASMTAGKKTNLSSLTASIIIPAADIGYFADKTAAATAEGKTLDTSKSIIEQRNGAVYANVYAGKTLTGSWHYAKTYKEAEVIEDAE